MMHPLFRVLMTLILPVIPLATLSAATAVGVVIHKDLPSTADGFADASEYRDFARFDAVTNFTTPNGTRLSLNNPQIVRIVPYPSPDSVPEILREADLARINVILTELTGLIQKYPQTGKFLKPRLLLLQSEIDRLRAGQAKFEGRWFPTRKALDDLLNARKAAAAAEQAAEKQRAEVLRMEGEKRRMQEAAELAATEQARAQQARMAQEAQTKARELERQAEEARKIAEEKKLMVARIEAQQQEEERRRKELQAAEERREEELLLYAADRFKKVDRFRSDLREPVLVR